MGIVFHDLDFHRYNEDNSQPPRLHLSVPYSEKEVVKKLGAKWNPQAKKWYIQTSNPRDYLKFSRWILRDYEEALIVSNCLWIIEGSRTCWKCKRESTIIGLGINNYMLVNRDNIKMSEDFGNPFADIRLAWVKEKDDVPTRLASYIENKYAVSTDFSKTKNRKCFSNHCEHCGAIQGDWFLFDEADSPLTTLCSNIDDLKNRIRKLKLYLIPIADNIILDWDFIISSEDSAYLKYAKVEGLLLADNEKDTRATYEELYESV